MKHAAGKDSDGVLLGLLIRGFLQVFSFVLFPVAGDIDGCHKSGKTDKGNYQTIGEGTVFVPEGDFVVALG